MVIPVPVRQRVVQTSQDCGLIIPLDCPECAKLTMWRVVSYTNKASFGCIFPIFPSPFTKTEYWLECQEGSHGYRLYDDGLGWAKRMDYLIRAYTKNEISESDYVTQGGRATLMIKRYISAECYKFPTYSEDEVVD